MVTKKQKLSAKLNATDVVIKEIPTIVETLIALEPTVEPTLEPTPTDPTTNTSSEVDTSVDTIADIGADTLVGSFVDTSQGILSQDSLPQGISLNTTPDAVQVIAQAVGIAPLISTPSKAFAPEAIPLNAVTPEPGVIQDGVLSVIDKAIKGIDTIKADVFKYSLAKAQASTQAPTQATQATQPTTPSPTTPSPLSTSPTASPTSDHHEEPAKAFSPEALADFKRQVDALTLDSNGGLLALCLDSTNPEYGNVLFRHTGTQSWVKQRPAAPGELLQALKTLESMRNVLKINNLL